MNLENKIEAQRKRMEQEKNKLDMLMKKAKMEQRKADNHRKIVVDANFETFLNEPRRYSEEQTRRIMQAVSDYDDYKQYQPVMKEYQALSGLRENSFKKKHETELENYAIYRDRVKAVMPENMKISKPYIDKQLAEVLAQQEQIQRKSSRVATDLARLSVFKGNLREMEVQQRADEQAREQNRVKKHENTI